MGSVSSWFVYLGLGQKEIESLATAVARYALRLPPIRQPVTQTYVQLLAP